MIFITNVSLLCETVGKAKRFLSLSTKESEKLHLETRTNGLKVAC